MGEFKVGDRVVGTSERDGVDLRGEIGVIVGPVSKDFLVKFDDATLFSEFPVYASQGGWRMGYSQIKLIEKKTSMSIIDKFNELTTAEPLKSFVKHGIKTQSGKLTDEGAELVLNLLASQPDVEAELVKVTDALNAAEAKSKK